MSAPAGAGQPPSGWRHRFRAAGGFGAAARALRLVAACYLSALLVVNLSTSSAAGVISRIFPHLGGGSALDQASVAAAWQAVQDNYVIRDVPGSEGTRGAGQGIVQALHDTYHDRFSAYLTAAEYQQLTSTLGGRREGSIGIAVEARCGGGAICLPGQAPDRAVIEEVLVDQPADRAGVRRGDILVAADGTSLASLGSDEGTRIDRAAAKVRGPVGSPVRLTLERGGTLLTVSVTRQNLSIPSVYTHLFGRVLYMQVTGFDTDTGDLARSRLSAGIAAGATSIILDLRANGGGYVSAAQSLVSEFLAPTSTQKDVVVRRGRLAPGGSPGSAREVVRDPIRPGGVALTEPLVVLVNGDSASAAEITTAALRDYHRATVVGDRTFGKGSVQVDFPLPGGADLHLTVERWYGPAGESIEGSGIAPDHPVSLATPDSRFELDAQSAPAAADAQLQECLALLAH